MSGKRATNATLLTPPGTGAIGVVRVSGPDSLAIVGRVFQPKKSDKPLENSDLGQLRYGAIIDGDSTIDEVVVAVDPARSCPTVDICCHGSVRVIERVLGLLERGGAPMVQPDEDHAEQWGGDSLIEREALMLLPNARSELAVRFLAFQREHLTPALEHVSRLCLSDSQTARKELEGMLSRYRAVRLLLDGARVAIVGPANSGKSTLFNRLVGRESAIVSGRAGTTRDWVSQTVEMSGVEVTLVDTAGVRETDSPLERQAVEVGRAVCLEADLRVLVLDGSSPLPDDWSAGSQDSRRMAENRYRTSCELAGVLPADPLVIAINKSDKQPQEDMSAVVDRYAPCSLAISARTGGGVDELIRRVLGALEWRAGVESVPCLFTARQREVALEVLKELDLRHDKSHNLVETTLIGSFTVTPEDKEL